MATRAAASKVRNLHDHQLRLLHSIVPVPSGCDVANTLKYFTTTLLTVMKDVPKSPLVMLKHAEEDAARMALFPSLDYKGLYNAVVQLIDVAPLVQFGLQAMGEATLHCLGCILPFLERDQIDSLPYVTSLTMAVFPRALHQKIVNTLCFYVLPFTIGVYVLASNWFFLVYTLASLMRRDRILLKHGILLGRVYEVIETFFQPAITQLIRNVEHFRAHSRIPREISHQNPFIKSVFTADITDSLK